MNATIAMIAPSVRFAPCPRFSELAEEPAVCECCGWSDVDHDEVVWLARPQAHPERLAS